MAEYLEVEWPIDSTLTIFVTIRDVDLNPVNISAFTGDDIRCAFATKPGIDADAGEAPTKVLNLDNGVSIVNGPTGAAKIELAEGDQDDFVAGTQYYFEVKAQIGGKAQAQLYGPASCRESIFENLPAS